MGLLDYRSKLVKTYIKRSKSLGNIVLEIDGYYGVYTPFGKYEWYDVFHRGVCVNEGEPFERMPTTAQLEKIVAVLRKEYALGIWKRRK